MKKHNLASKLHSDLVMRSDSKTVYIHSKKTGIVFFKGSLKKATAFNKGYLIGWGSV
jgi:hypothetical protein